MKYNKTTATKGLAKRDERALTRSEFHALAEVPAEVEWFANIDNERTRRAYRIDVEEFARFVGIESPIEFRQVTRSHVLSWRKNLLKRGLSPATIRRKLSALSSLFAYLCDNNAVHFNPVTGVKRPSEGANEGKTPAISDAQALSLLIAPPSRTLKGVRDRAILSVFLYHGLRVDELCKLRIRDLAERRGVLHLRVRGKGGKTRYVPLHPQTAERIDDYLSQAEHGKESSSFLFRPITNNKGGSLKKGLSTTGVYKNIVLKYAKQVGITTDGFCTHSLRATAATNALENEADIAKVQEWLGHSNIATTRLYDRRQTRPEDSPTFKVAY